jgi:HPr kinase/phosphorylase
MPNLTLQALYDERRDKLALAWRAGTAGRDRALTSEMLADRETGTVGHLNLIRAHHIQVMGLVEQAYLSGMGESRRTESLSLLFEHQPWALIVTDALDPLPELVEYAESSATPLFTTPVTSKAVVSNLAPYLQRRLGATTTLHGVLLDVLGVGVLITGDSSIGKSELALELISRGAGLVADDVVEVQQVGAEILQGRCPELLRDVLEVRGLGVLDIKAIFGETQVRPRKTVALLVELHPDSPSAEPQPRLVAAAAPLCILGVDVPRVTLTVKAGRNLAVLVEAAVRNHVLLTRGIDSTRQFIHRQHALMRADDGTR